MAHLALITADQARALLPGLSAAEYRSCADLCAPASRAVEGWCRTRLGFGSWLEYHRPGQTRTIRLKNAQVIPGTVELRAGFARMASVACVDPSATRATAALTATTLVLARSSPARPTPTVVPLSSLATLADLAAAVNAQAGWQCSIATGQANWLVADLEPNPGAMGALGGATAGVFAYTADLSAWAMDNPHLGEIELTRGHPQAFRFPDRAWVGDSDPRSADVRCSYQAGFDPAGVLAPGVPEDLAQAVALTIRAGLDSGRFSGIVTAMELGNSKVEVGPPMAVPPSAKGFLSRYVLRRI